MFKIVNDMVPLYLSERFVKRETEHGYNTRGNHINLSLPKPNTNFQLSIALITVEQPLGILYQ